MMEMEYVLARKIRELANRITQTRDSDIRELGLTTTQADCILYFAENEGKSAVDLKTFLGITHQAARSLVERMTAKELLKVTTSREDARYKKVFLTEKGITVYEKMQKNGTYTGSRLLHGMSAEEKKQFLSMVSLALENLDAAGVQVEKGEESI